MYTYSGLIMTKILVTKRPKNMKVENWIGDREIHITCERMQSKDCTWLREMESPIKAHDLFLIRARNLLGLNFGISQPRGLHLQ